jgi:hypothetical protein
MPVGQIDWPSKILSSPSDKHKSLYDFAKSALWCARSVSPEGRIAIVTDVEAECGGCGVSQRSFGSADEWHGADGEVVWSWHPGADAQRNALARCRDTGARKPVPGEITYKPLKPSRREGRAFRAKPVVTAACVFCCRRAMGAAGARSSLRPPS